jgi:rubrerythrin
MAQAWEDNMETQEPRPDEATFDDLLCNRTGIMNHPELSAQLIESAKNTSPSSEGDAEQIAASRAEYLNEALPIGSPPLMRDVLQNEPIEEGSVATDLEGVVVLLDKLGERLAFERQGTRLYQAFLQKFQALGEEDGLGPTSAEIQHICDEELEHFRIVQKAIARLGGDATVETPSADVAVVLSHGILQIVSDPRTTVPQMLQALLSAELADNDGWQLLQQVAAEIGDRDLEEECRKAFEKEQEHLEKVRSWLLEITIDEAAGVIGDDTDIEDADIEHGADEPSTKRPKRRRSKQTSTKKSSSSKARKRSKTK